MGPIYLEFLNLEFFMSSQKDCWPVFVSVASSTLQQLTENGWIEVRGSQPAVLTRHTALSQALTVRAFVVKFVLQQSIERKPTTSKIKLPLPPFMGSDFNSRLLCSVIYKLPLFCCLGASLVSGRQWQKETFVHPDRTQRFHKLHPAT